LFFENLELRKLLSAAFDAQTGIVTVTGTSGRDTIEFANGTSTITVVQTTDGVSTPTSFDTAKVKRIIVNAGDSADKVIMGKVSIPCVLNGGRGNDSLSAGGGNDSLFGNGGDDYMFGGDGKDLLDGNTEGDDMFGGGGLDTVDYSTRSANLTITLGGVDHFPWRGDTDQYFVAVFDALGVEEGDPAPRAAREGHGTDELTRRETEVLALVASGLSDREIAERLVLSPHTVHRHVANVRTKLGLPTRAAAVAAAAQRGLL